MTQSQLRGLLLVAFLLLFGALGAYLKFHRNNKINIRNYIPQLPLANTTNITNTTKTSLPRNVEINTADSLTLLGVPGIGPVLAHRIIKYRNQKKYFRSIEELTQIRGLDYEKIAHFLVLDSSLLQEWEKKYAIRPPAYQQNLNTLSLAALQATNLLDSSLASRLIQYRNKKGGFANWNQVAKVYGLEKRQIELLQKYYYLELPLIELNQADSLALVGLPGIGPKLAMRILKYKKLLGGYYYSVNQLREVYGISEQVYEQISKRFYVDTLAIKKMPKIRINFIPIEDLQKHPYLKNSPRLAQRIINFRNKYGPFRSFEDLNKVYGMSPELISKIGPYISYEEVE